MKKLLLTAFTCVSGLVIMAQTYTGDKTRIHSEKLNDSYCSGLFKSADGTILDIQNDISAASSYSNILDWMEGKVSGLQVYYFRHNLKVPFIRGTQAAIYVDEMPVDAGYLNMLSMNDIAMVKVIKGPFAGSIGGNSVIAIYTIHPEENEE